MTVTPDHCRVRELEKARFRKRTRLALYRNRSPLMKREGAAVRLVGCCAEESRYIWKTYIWRYIVLRGLFLLKIIFD